MPNKIAKTANEKFSGQRVFILNDKNELYDPRIVYHISSQRAILSTICKTSCNIKIVQYANDICINMSHENSRKCVNGLQRAS